LRSVVTLNPGGLEHGGGIGRMIGYMVGAWPTGPGTAKFTIIDSRGPGRKDLALGFFALALVRVLVAGLFRRPLVHVHLAGRGSTLRKIMIVHLAAMMRLPVVLHLHDYNYAAFLDSLPAWAMGPIRSMFHRADLVVVLGALDQRTAVERLGVPECRVRIIANSVPDPARSETLAAVSPDDPVTILFLGDPSRRKGVHDLLAAFASEALKPDGAVPSWRAVVAGGGKELSEFQTMSARAGLEDRVAFPGWLGLDEARALLARCDILVLPSYNEGLAMSVLEGMSYGKCVVCTPVGALSEVVVHDVSGRIVAPGDPQALAEALRSCIADPDLRRRLGHGAYARFSAAYNVADYPARMMDAYVAALSRHSARARV
jgi:glycosyltransferase involved in cell wall biosynthesis